MEKKRSKFGKSMGWAILTYVVISVIAGALWIVCGFGRGEGASKVSGEAVLMLVLVPVLFLLAGYIGSVVHEFEKFKTHRVWLFAAGFSLFLLLLWYVQKDLYVVLNLPAGVGGYALDVFFRKTTVVRDYEVLFLANTDGYKYAVLPLLHFVFRIIYWLFYLWGNRIYVSKQTVKGRSKR